MNIEDKIRENALGFRLRVSMDMVIDMCKEGRPPKTSIPIHWEDEDIFILTTIRDAIEALSPAAIVARYEELKSQGLIVTGQGSATVNIEAKEKDNVPTQ